MQGGSTITFNGVTATATTWSDTFIATQVPIGATTGNVVVTAGGVSSSGVNFTVVPVPHITALSEYAGSVGDTLTITGTNFGTYNPFWLVNFSGGVFAKPTPADWSDTSIVVQIPAGAITGVMNVWASGVFSEDVPFIVQPLIAIDAVTPTYAAETALVYVLGNGFGATQGASTVSFNGVAATATTWSDGLIATHVPLGATSGNVVVTTPTEISNGVAFSVVPVPQITGLSVTSAPVGATLTITGTNFGPYNQFWLVNFTGGVFAKPASSAEWSNSSIVIQVPAGAISGVLNVWASGVQSNIVPFTVTP